MKTRISLPFFCVLFCVVFVSCKKDEEKQTPAPASELEESRRDAFSENVFTEAQSLAEEALANGSVQLRTTAGVLNCAIVTLDTTAFPITATIDFGATNCTGNDGRARRGKILITLTGPYRQAGTEISIGFDNYFVNDNQVLGTKVIQNNGRNPVTNYLEYTVVVNGQINWANGDSGTWQANRLREWVAGDATHMIADDIYQITGSATGVRASGRAYTAQITAPLVRKLAQGCRRHFVSGTYKIMPQGLPARTIDYGNGACDNLATLTINGQTYNITLP